MRKFSEALHRQLERNENKNLLHSKVADFIDPDPTFLAALEDLLQTETVPLHDRRTQEIISLAAGALVERVYSINQYIQVGPDAIEALKGIYLSTWQKIVDTKDIQDTLRNYHYPELSAWIKRLYPQAMRKHLSALTGIGRVICEEYSPELQANLLRLDVPDIREPVLDLGCGKNALLVNHLRSNRIEAFGIDRSIKNKSAYLQEADWLSYRFEPSSWGTIISNLSFTNHYVYAEHYDPGKIPTYITKYKEIAESLKPKGCFIYAPGAPGLERQLNSGQYRIEKWNAFRGYEVVKVTRNAP